jgi:hypothetical protein
MSLPILYKFLDAEKKEVGWCNSTYFITDVPSLTSEQLANEAVEALGRYIGFLRIGHPKQSVEKLKRIAFVVIEGNGILDTAAVRAHAEKRAASDETDTTLRKAADNVAWFYGDQRQRQEHRRFMVHLHDGRDMNLEQWLDAPRDELGKPMEAPKPVDAQVVSTASPTRGGSYLHRITQAFRRHF